MKSLDPELIFRILVLSDAEPTFVAGVDPAAGPITVRLRPLDPKRRDPKTVVRGRVVDSKGTAVVGATIAADTLWTGEFEGTCGAIEGLDPLSISNQRGEFLLATGRTNVKLDVVVRARGLAPRRFSRLPVGGPENKLVMSEGVTVTGRLVKGDKPVAGVGVGLVQVSRNTLTFLGTYEIGTDENGGFQINNVAPGFEYFVYGLMESMGKSGAVPATKVQAGGDGTILRVGELRVVPGHQLAGRVTLSDGKAVPAGTRLLVSRERAWDSMLVELDRDGRFRIAGLPTEEYTLSVQVAGYFLSKKNKSLDSTGMRLLGLVDRDIEDLTILLERGEWKRPDRSENRPGAGARPLDKMPLEGADVP